MQGNDGTYEPGFNYTIDSDNQLPVLSKMQNQKEEKKVERKASEEQ